MEGEKKEEGEEITIAIEVDIEIHTCHCESNVRLVASEVMSL